MDEGTSKLLPVGSPEWMRAVEVATARPGRAMSEARAAVEALTRKLNEDLRRGERAATAARALELVYGGEIDHARAILAVLPPEQVQAISTAAALLASTAEDVLKGVVDG